MLTTLHSVAVALLHTVEGRLYWCTWWIEQ